MNLFKNILLFLCLIITLSFLSHKPETKQVTVQFASWGSESEINILKPILRDFENQNPEIKIDFMHIPQNYFQKIHLLFASNTAPDVIFINNLYLPIYANAGVLEDLSDFDFEGFYPKSVETLSWQGKNYAVPRDISNIVIFYNRDLFKKFGVNEPEEGWTLEDLKNKAQKLTNSPSLFGISFDENPILYLPYLTTCGEWIDDELNGLKFYADLRNKYHVAPRREEIASATMAQMFLQGHLAMQTSGRWLVPKYREEAKFDWDVVEFPACKQGEQSIVPMDASGWAISKNSKHKQEALKLVSFLASKESSAKFTQSGLITPARKDVDDVFFDGKKPKNAKVFLKVAQTSIPTPVTVNYNEVLDKLKSRVEYMFNQ